MCVCVFSKSVALQKYEQKKKVKSYSNLLELSENIRLYIKVGKPMVRDEIRTSVQGL